MTATTKTTDQIVTIDGSRYRLDDLSDHARNQLTGVSAAEAQIGILNNQLALVKTARATYAGVLSQNLPEKQAAANKKQGVILLDDKKYNLADLSEEAEAQLNNIRFADQEINRLQAQKTITEMARQAYAQYLLHALQGTPSLKK